MKTPEEATACVVDYGSFLSLADKLSEKMAKVYFYSPYESEYLEICPCVKGDGLERVDRLDDPLDPEILPSIDLFVFPDRGYGGLQRHLREIGKAVWGSMGACEIEEYRTRFVDLLQRLGLPMVNSVKIKGLTNLAAYLKENDNKWVKVNRYREDMETWKHRDYDHSVRDLEKLALKFGPIKELVWFVVQDDIESDLEIGYDGWCIHGHYPDESFQGYEAKNELYLGSKRAWHQLPEQVKEVNEAMAPVLREYGYCNFWATEIRVKDDVGYFIDPTARMPGQTGEQLLETCENLAEIIWRGAQGEVVQPKWVADHAAEATLHYTAGSGEDWKTIRVPEEVRPWAKLYHYCELDGLCHFPPHRTDELGVLLGIGGSVQEAFDALKENLENFGDEPVSAKLEGFAELFAQVQEAEDNGMAFTDQPVPEPEAVLKDS